MKFTKERREIRDRAKALKAEIEAAKAVLKEVRKALEKLQDEECAHPADRHGVDCGMSWSHCPDCGRSHP